jgi:hypothetical protein
MTWKIRLAITITAAWALFAFWIGGGEYMDLGLFILLIGLAGLPWAAWWTWRGYVTRRV